MTMYDYRQAKKDILSILNSKTEIMKCAAIPKADSTLTYENGIKAWTAAIFVDIIKSTEIFKNEKEERVARVMRAFTSEIISILSSDDKYRQIGIRGDCVFGIYSAENKEDLVELFRHAYLINTFLLMLNKTLEENGFFSLSAGIGLGCSEELIVKAGKKGSGINDVIWIGDAVVDASNLSGMANRGGIEAIAMTRLFYTNIIDILKDENKNYSIWIKEKTGFYGNEGYYHCNIVQTDFDKWIDEGMKI